MAILSGLFCVTDIDRNERIISPLYDPPLFAEFVIITQARRTLSNQARRFLEIFEAEIERIQQVWARMIPPTMFPERPARKSGKRK